MANMFPPDCSCGAYQASQDCGPLGINCWQKNLNDLFNPPGSKLDTRFPGHKVFVEPGSKHVGTSILGTRDPVPNPDPGKNPASGCPNCGDELISSIPCQVQKAFCEAGHAATGGFGQILPYIALGGGVLLIILIAAKR